MTAFNPDEFMTSTVEAKMSTSYEPVPEGEYRAVISDATAKVTPTGKAVLEVKWAMDCPEEPLAHEKSVRQAVWLDITDSGGLDTSRGKNVQLGRLREAVGQNKKTDWSPNELIGQVANVLVSHRITDDAVYPDIKKVAAA